jgi:hypothetical protein
MAALEDIQFKTDYDTKYRMNKKYGFQKSLKVRFIPLLLRLEKNNSIGR